MKIAIIEDEVLSAEKLERYLMKYDSTNEVVAIIPSIEEAVKWFKNGDNEHDVIFMDIQLTDGLSFEIFRQVTIKKPVVFTTAFDEYAIDAFKVNSIDYILKPITFTDLSGAMSKLNSMKDLFRMNHVIANVEQMMEKKKLKDRFLVRLGNHIHSIKVEDIYLFFAEGRTVYLVTNAHKKFVLDYKLEDLTNILNSMDFFRVNRTFIVNINAIEDVVVYSSSRLKITLKVQTEKEVIVSREKVGRFKKWFEGN